MMYRVCVTNVCPSGLSARALVASLLVAICLAAVPVGAASWRDASNRSALQNDALDARFQAGMLYALKDRATGQVLLAIEPEKLPSQMLIFDKIPTDLDSCKVAIHAVATTVQASYQLPSGDALQLRWSIEPGKGDLVLQVSSKTAQPIEELRYTFVGCDIASRALVWVSALGAGNVMRAPWNDVQLGDPQKDQSPGAYPQPLVALFQAEKTGWFIEGRDPRIGPANVMAKGFGNTVNIGMTRRFLIPQRNPDLYEVRIRTYKDHWEDAVDPYIAWLEKGAGLIPIDKLPKEQAWVQNIKTQAYVEIGDFDGIEALAKRVDPAKTFVGRQDGFRPYAMGIHYPDYHFTDVAKKWVKRVRELGFHVGVHFNSNMITTDFPELVERFRPGFMVTGKDAKGNDTYESLLDGYCIRTSPALKDFRHYLIAQMKEAIDNGVDVIYLDEGGGPLGKPVVDGVDGFQGLMSLMKETLEAYPHIALETEQVNTLTAKYSKFALSQMPLGHPLGGYIYQKYVKIVPEGIMYSPTDQYSPQDSPLMDAFDYFGYMLPGADANREESWLQIAEAYQKYNLVPDGRLPRKQILHTRSHWSSGVVPIEDGPVPAEGEKHFGLKGGNGVTAFFEKYPTKRGLVVYEPGKQPQWIGTRHFGIRSWEGPGVPVYFGFRQQMRDWLIYNDTSLLGLDPLVSYAFDETVQRSPTRFHVTKVPRDFIGITHMERRIPPYEVGKDDSFFRLFFAGHGRMSMYVPDEYDVYLDGRKLEVDRRTKAASATIDASPPDSGGTLGYFIVNSNQPASGEKARAGGRPSTLLAFKRTDTELAGKWVDLPWQQSKDNAKWIDRNKEEGFSMNAGAFGIFIGKFPQAKNICLEGSYKVTLGNHPVPSDGVVLINGKPVLRVPAGEPPYNRQDFSADISSYAGQYVLMEIIPDGAVRGTVGEWFQPRIVVKK